MEIEGVKDLIRLEALRAGTQKALAARVGCTEAYISDVLHNRREPRDDFLAKFGIERVVSYEYIMGNGKE